MKRLYIKGWSLPAFKIKGHGSVLLTISDKDKQEALLLARRFHNIGFKLIATSGTAVLLQQSGILTAIVGKIGEEGTNLLDVIRNGEAQCVINTLTKGKQLARDGFRNPT